jgi:hypothetical protein
MGLVWTTLGLGLLGAGAYETARHGFRQPAGLSRLLAAVVIGWSWLTIGMELFGTTGALSRETLLGWSAAALVVGLACRALDRRHPIPNQPAGPTETWGWYGTIAVWLTLWVVAIYAPGSLLYPVKVVSDGPIYHLYFAARWWKAHHLELVATPFGENAATYFPANGDLWFCWLMIVWGGDTLAKVGQGPFLLAAALAVTAIAQRLGAGRASTLIAVAWFLTSYPLLLFSFETNVDMSSSVMRLETTARARLRSALWRPDWPSEPRRSASFSCRRCSFWRVSRPFDGLAASRASCWP